MQIHDPATPPDDADRQLRLMLAEVQHDWRLSADGNLRQFTYPLEAIVYYAYLRGHLLHRVKVYLKHNELTRALLKLTKRFALRLITSFMRNEANSGNAVDDSRVVGYKAKHKVYRALSKDIAGLLVYYEQRSSHSANILSRNLLYARQEKDVYEAKLYTHKVVDMYLEIEDVFVELLLNPRYALWARDQLPRVSQLMFDMKVIKSKIQEIKKAQQQRLQPVICEARRSKDWSHRFFRVRGPWKARCWSWPECTLQPPRLALIILIH